MKLLESKKLQIPKVFFVSEKSDLPKIPIGVPFIFADADMEEHIVRLLEYEVLYQAAVRSGYPFNFRKILIDNGYLDIESFGYHHPAYGDYKTEKEYSEDDDLSSLDMIHTESGMYKFKDFVRDSACYVDTEKLKSLNVFPVWLDKIEQAISTNIHNFATFNYNMYNKKLEGMYGGIELASPNRNLIIIDISGSIPRAVSTTCLNLAKNLMESFYSDLVITGSKSTLYQYENIHTLDVQKVYDDNGMDNDQVWFKKLVTQEEREYKTAIVFGDNHSPSYHWSNNFNKNTKTISREDGQKLCKWKVQNLISLHTSSIEKTAGYADWFKPDNIEKIAEWVKYLK